MTAIDYLSPLRFENGKLHLLDQRLLPLEEVWLPYGDYREVAKAIKDMVVRGAPAIGCTAAYGVALGVMQGAAFQEIVDTLAATRPTAVNLFWALHRMEQVEPKNADTMVAEARKIHEEDIAACLAMGGYGGPLLPDGGVLTHCNAGGLATGGYGTALGVIRSAVTMGKKINVFADETRPFLQGSRLTAWEMKKCSIDVTVITDNMAAYLMKKGLIQSVIVGADRIARNGDVANKIGTYNVALLARAHEIPFYVAAPLTTVDRTTVDGDHIIIEERPATEVTHIRGLQLTPNDVKVRNPAFDVTPNHLVTAVITDRGIIRAPFEKNLTDLLGTAA